MIKNGFSSIDSLASTCVESCDVEALLAVVLGEHLDEAGVSQVELAQLARRPPLLAGRRANQTYC